MSVPNPGLSAPPNVSAAPSRGPDLPGAPASPIDTALLSRLASAMFAALPGESGDLPTSLAFIKSPTETRPAFAPSGVQAPLQLAPSGSPLASPAGFGPGVPGTPIPQGQIPGSNLIPASPGQVLTLGNRAPAGLPHAVAG
ncbi:MAG: hypothetical protein V4772_25690, partial [Pseudomonadota bacterium]